MTTLTYDSIEGLLKSLSENGSSENTIRAYRGDLREFLTWINRAPGPPAVDLADLAKIYLTELREVKSAKTVKRKASAMNAWARHVGLLPLTKGYRFPTPARQRAHPIPEGVNGVLDMLAVCKNPKEQALVALTGLCGLRVGEAIKVMPQDILLPDKVLHVFGKGSKERDVPIGRVAWNWIEPAFVAAIGKSPGTLVGMKDRAARYAFKRIGARAHLSRDVASHDGRMTFGTAVFDKTKDIRVTQELLGHASPETTMIYTGINEQKMREAVEIA